MKKMTKMQAATDSFLKEHPTAVLIAEGSGIITRVTSPYSKIGAAVKKDIIASPQRKISGYRVVTGARKQYISQGSEWKVFYVSQV